MSIQLLQNPKTPNYLEFKKLVFDREFKWEYTESATGMPFYVHGLLKRPEGSYSVVSSDYAKFCMFCVHEILQHNNIEYKFFLRSALNCVHPDNDVQLSKPHVDHDFPHINVIIYLTDAGGKTYCEDEFHDPKEDDVILMVGEHWMERPKVGRRIVSVSTLFI
mgnify:CR=1 FL=1|tara:strand:+ start:81 stop:569 length:489 start_codon:yes stop_codon:yes gene_type:complete